MCVAAARTSAYSYASAHTAETTETGDDLKVVIRLASGFDYGYDSVVSWGSPPRRSNGWHVPPTEGLQFDTTQPKRQVRHGAKAIAPPRPHRSKSGAFHR